MNKRTFITTTLIVAATMCANAAGLLHDLTYQVRLGYNLGGTAPIGMPATIRGLDKFTPKATFTLGIDALRHLDGPWGVKCKRMANDSKACLQEMSSPTCR